MLLITILCRNIFFLGDYNFNTFPGILNRLTPVAKFHYHIARRIAFTRSSKRPALARVFWIHLLEVCWTFAGSCEHPITAWSGSTRGQHHLVNSWSRKWPLPRFS